MFLNRDQDNASDDNRFDIISDSVIMVDIDISQYQFLIELFFVIKKNISNISSRKSRTVLNKQRGWGYYLNPFASTEEVNSDVATNYKFVFLFNHDLIHKLILFKKLGHLLAFSHQSFSSIFSEKMDLQIY